LFSTKRGEGVGGMQILGVQTGSSKASLPVEGSEGIETFVVFWWA
jgi:hypothetical protein